jgi:hypothetical protein
MLGMLELATGTRWRGQNAVWFRLASELPEWTCASDARSRARGAAEIHNVCRGKHILGCRTFIGTARQPASRPGRHYEIRRRRFSEGHSL